MSEATIPPPDHDGILLDQRVAAEQVRLIHQQLPISISGTVTAATLLVVVLWPVVPGHWLLPWLAAMLANQAWRLSRLRRFRREGIADRDHADWGRSWTVGAVISGVLWGCAAMFFFVPQSPLHQLLLLVMMFAMMGTGVALLAPHPPSFFAFFLPSATPVIARNLLEGDPPHLVVALITFIMMLAIVAVGRRNHAMITESLRNRFRNVELVGQLQRQNDELERARELAEQVSRAKTRFFAAASHDLRQPLHALGLFAGALAERAREPEVLQLVHSITSSVDALEALFNELLDISKIDAGVVKPNVEAFDVQAVFDRLAHDLEPEAAEKGLRLRVRPTPAVARSDPLLVERVLRNLLANAHRYTERGGILLAARRRGPRLSLEVWDTGPGIPEDQTERIFEEFYQLAGVARGGRRGMGLGLSIVRRLCALLDCRLSLRSREGCGSVFRLDLPAAARAERTPADAPAPQLDPAGTLAGTVILVVDDEEVVVAGMCLLLEGWGARIVSGASEEEARARIAAQRLRPDLVISDLRLRQGADGFALVASLRSSYGEALPAILVTGSASPQNLSRARAANLHLLLKPVNPARLRTLLHFKLRRHGSGEG